MTKKKALTMQRHDRFGIVAALAAALAFSLSGCAAVDPPNPNGIEFPINPEYDAMVKQKALDLARSAQKEKEEKREAEKLPFLVLGKGDSTAADAAESDGAADSRPSKSDSSDSAVERGDYI